MKVKIDEKIHNQFRKELNKFHQKTRGKRNKRIPSCFMLGKNNKGIVTEITPLRPYRGASCHQMAHITTKDMIRGALRLYKKELIPCGLVRIGAFHDSNSHNRGFSLYEIARMSKDAFVISFSRDCVEVQKYQRERYTQHGYLIISDNKVRSKRREVKKNASNHSKIGNTHKTNHSIKSKGRHNR